MSEDRTQYYTLSKGKQSELERVFEHYLRALGGDLPRHEREYRFHSKRRWRFDWAWPESMLAVEIDGGQWVRGGGRHNSDKDREKLNAAALNGWRMLRFSGGMLRRDPASCVETVRMALRVMDGIETDEIQLDDMALFEASI